MTTETATERPIKTALLAQAARPKAQSTLDTSTRICTQTLPGFICLRLRLRVHLEVANTKVPDKTQVPDLTKFPTSVCLTQMGHFLKTR